MSIGQVLSQIRSSTADAQPFLLRIVISQGRSQGKIRTLAQCIKGFPTAKKPVSRPGSGQGKFLYKEHDVVNIIDLEDSHKLKTIPISHIIGYNTYQVNH